MSTQLVLSVIGTVVGAVYGGPAGAAAGFSIGEGVGSPVVVDTAPSESLSHTNPTKDINEHPELQR